MQDGVLDGVAVVPVVDYSNWTNSSRSWHQVQSFGELVADGIEDISVSTANTCSRGCTVSPDVDSVLLRPPGEPAIDLDLSLRSPGSATDTTNETTVFTFAANNGPVLSAPTVETTAPVRCDSQPGNRYASGCVDPDITPNYVLSETAYPTIGLNVVVDITFLGAPTLLTRITNKSQISANRRAACKGFRKENPTDTCDEYPFASTMQGGATADQFHVTSSENSAQGGNLGGFYVRNRLINGDDFTVSVGP